MPAAPLFALLALAGLGAAAAASSKHGPAPTSGSYELDPHLPADVQAHVLSAIGTVVDPAQLDALAAQLDAQGWHLTATAVRQRATELRAHPPPAPMPTPALPPQAQPHGHGHAHGHWPHPGPQAPAPAPLPGPYTGPVPPPPYGTPYATPPAMPPPAVGPAGLDPNIDNVTAQAVLVALATENDPAKLHGFAIAIQAQYPIAAHLLEQKRLILLQTQAATIPPMPAPPAVRPPPASRVSSEIRDVQHALNVLGGPGTPLAEDGINGPRTTAAVRAFQSAHGLKVDGIVGPQTHAALTAALAANAPHVATEPPPPAAAPPSVVPIQPPPARAASRGTSAIRDVQHALNMLHTPGTPLAEDGLNGPRTTAAVKAFQAGHGLAVDGIAGPRTQAALTAALSGEPPAVLPIGALEGVQSVPAFAPSPAHAPPHAVPMPTRSTAPASRGTSAIRDVQHGLNVLAGAGLKEDGIAGPATTAAIRAFQNAHGLPADGVAGPQTQSALSLALAHLPPAASSAPPVVLTRTAPPPAAGPAQSPAAMSLRDVQHALNVLHVPGTPIAEDGKRGPRTSAAVKAFQAAHGLKVDGIAGPQTFAALTSALSATPVLPAASLGHAAANA